MAIPASPLNMRMEQIMENDIIDYAIMLLETEHTDEVVQEFLRLVTNYRRAKATYKTAKSDYDVAFTSLHNMISE
jgi:hypothetical protein